jgi:hypothetical protein
MIIAGQSQTQTAAIGLAGRSNGSGLSKTDRAIVCTCDAGFDETSATSRVPSINLMLACP